MEEREGKVLESEGEGGITPLSFRKFDFLFLGSGDFAVLVLRKLLELNVVPRCVITAPDKPRGRGLKLKPTEVKVIAIKSRIEVAQSQNPNDPDFVRQFRAPRPQFIVVTDYGYILRRDWLELPEVAPLNIHPSLLPLYRGAAPIERAMMNCERETGVSIMVMDQGVDTGPIVLQEKVTIEPEITKGELQMQLAQVGAELLIRAMEGLVDGSLSPVPQSGQGSYAKKLKKEELWIDWNDDARRIACKINALSPKPGARTFLDGELTKLLRARPIMGVHGVPGDVIITNKRMFIAASEGAVEILELQPASGKKLSATAYVQGRRPKKAQMGISS